MRTAVLQKLNLTLSVCGHKLAVLRIRGGREDAPELVFLHEGLGSVSHWKHFPARVAEVTGCPVTVYSRYGSGNSDLLNEPHSVRYMHDEALQSLPELLSQLEIENPILVGHSDGASIAIIHAGVHSRVRGLVLLAPHVFVEDLSVASIAEARVNFETTNLPESWRGIIGTQRGRFGDGTISGWIRRFGAGISRSICRGSPARAC